MKKMGSRLENLVDVDQADMIKKQKECLMVKLF